ncbi:MAG: sulfatase-like hydrolase/transferase [Peptostreptococcaceae bacterium]|nr:sulfatase-like hydrolase/transferase [Peptostreptococcaceae bacterium]MDY5739414.1 sulfatase-like hydrolase/transferase [Anaerovoracaceae bacterium]
MRRIKELYEKYLHNNIGFCFGLAFLLNFFMESLARKGVSIFGGVLFMVQHPLIFFYNVLIIFATLSIGMLFRRRVFAIVMLTTVWLAIAIANGVILTQRMTPFTVKDLSAITDGATLITNYMSKLQIILIAVGLILAVIAVVVLFIKGPKLKEKIEYKKAVAKVLLIGIITGGATFGAIQTGIVSTFFGNLAYAYRDYGIPYCFISTWANTGIKKPSGYTAENVKALLEKSGQSVEKGGLKQEDVDEKYPNIIYLQLESFIDPMLFKNIKLSEDPIPNYRKLMEQYSGGDLTVPACGAGTANTEFETMTGISARFFGPGEYPYKSVLSDRTMESSAFVLKSMGYSTHAIHNHRAVFYNRNTVFANIGYDTFTSLEYMSDVPKTPKNWAKDSILTNEIMDTLKATEGRDYIHTISVQGHGKYPPEQVLKNPKIKVVEAPDEELKWKYEYYVNQMYEMDKFVKELTDTLADFDEPVVLVMFGDHIPALDITEDTYAAKDLYTTQYVIWSNEKTEKKSRDLYAYEIMSTLFNDLGIHKGTVFKYQQEVDHGDSGYLEGLKTLGYDMLYGKKYVYGKNNPFEAAKMKMGVKNIKIQQVVAAGGKYYIKGKNFTEYSVVTLNGETLKTIYLSPNLLGLQEDVNPADVTKMKVSQIDRNSKEIISTTE